MKIFFSKKKINLVFKKVFFFILSRKQFLKVIKNQKYVIIY